MFPNERKALTPSLSRRRPAFPGPLYDFVVVKRRDLGSAAGGGLRLSETIHPARFVTPSESRFDIMENST